MPDVQADTNRKYLPDESRFPVRGVLLGANLIDLFYDDGCSFRRTCAVDDARLGRLKK